jgi:IMP cyclohydrolase
MATTYKVLGRKASDATTMEELYAVPSSTEAVISTITVCNRSSSARTYRIAIKPTTGTTIADEHYIAYDVIIAANDTTALTLGLTLAAANSIQVYASASASLTFQAFGSEIA